MAIGIKSNEALADPTKLIDPFQKPQGQGDYIANLPTRNPPPSFWQLTHQSKLSNVFDSSDADDFQTAPETSDILIIGGGMTGVTAAYHAAHKIATSGEKRSITILEARGFCGGATGRNGGHLSPSSALHYSAFARNSQSYLLKHLDSTSISKREEVHGNDRGSKSDETIRKMLTLEQRTCGELIMLIRSEEAKKRKVEMKKRAMERFNGSSVSSQESSDAGTGKVPEAAADLVSGSNWYLCFSEEEEKLCHESLEKAKRAGLSDLARNVRKVTKEEIDKSLSAPPNLVAAFEQPGSTVHPLKLVSLIWQAAVAKAEERGISLKYYTHCPIERVEEIDEGAYKCRAMSKFGIRAKHLIHATNGYISRLVPQLSGTIIPTRAQVIAAQPTSNDHWSMGFGSNGGFEYAFQRAKNSSTLSENEGKPPLVIFGGGRWKATGMEWGVSDDGKKDENISEFLHSYLSTQFPNSFDSPRASSLLEWNGIMGYTSHSDPLVGPLLHDFSDSAKPQVIEGQYLSGGFSGHGMSRCYSCSEVVIDLIVAKENKQTWKAPNWFPLCYLTALPSEVEVEAQDSNVQNGR